MAAKASFAAQFPQLRFPVWELTPNAWAGPRRLGNRGLTHPAYVDDVGELHSVTVQFGKITAEAPWWSVESTARGAFGSAGDAPYLQIHTHDTTPEQRARFMLGFALRVVDVLRHGPGRAEDPQLHDARWTPSEAAPTESTEIPIDGLAVDFCTVTADGLHAAATTRPDGTVTLAGRGQLGDLALRSVTDPEPYLSARD